MRTIQNNYQIYQNDPHDLTDFQFPYWQSDQRFFRSLEMEIWHDLAYMYISLSQWRDVEICLSKSKSISSFSAVSWHVTGKPGFPFCSFSLDRHSSPTTTKELLTM